MHAVLGVCLLSVCPLYMWATRVSDFIFGINEEKACLSFRWQKFACPYCDFILCPPF
jgi:hypothetical protein